VTFALDNHAGVGQNAGMSTTLKTELETFRREFPNLLAEPANHEKFVLIHGETVAGIYPDLKSGLEAGLEKFEFAPYLVKRITAYEKPPYFSRNLRCPT